MSFYLFLQQQHFRLAFCYCLGQGFKSLTCKAGLSICFFVLDFIYVEEFQQHAVVAGFGFGLWFCKWDYNGMCKTKKQKNKSLTVVLFTGWVLRSENLYHTPFYSPCPLAVMSHIYIEKEARKKNPFSWLSGWRVTSQAPSNVCLVAWNGATVTTPLPLWKVHLFSIWCSSCTKRAERSERRLSPSLSLSWAAADTLPLLWAIEKRKEKKKLLTPTENVMWTQGCPAEKSYQIKPYYLFLLSSNDKAAALYQQLSGSV